MVLEQIPELGEALCSAAVGGGSGMGVLFLVCVANSKDATVPTWEAGWYREGTGSKSW